MSGENLEQLKSENINKNIAPWWWTVQVNFTVWLKQILNIQETI